MATFPAHGTSDPWDDDLLTWLLVAHNSDGTLAVTPGTVPAGQDYTLITDDTTVTAYDSTGNVADSGTDVGAIVTGLATDRTSFVFGSGVFPWTTAIDIDLLIGVSLIGQGGLQNESKGAVGGRGATQLKWTPASGTAFSAVGTQGLHVNGISFQYTSSSYTCGDATEDANCFMTIEGVDHSTPTRHTLFENFYIGATGSGKLDCGGPLLDVNKTVNITFRNGLFCGGTMQIRSHHTVTDDDFANVVEFTACRFSRHKSSAWPSFRGSGISWAFRNCHWEPSQSGQLWTHETVVENFEGLTFEDCWWGDQSNAAHAANTAHIYFKGYGLRIIGGHIDLQNDYSIVKFTGSTNFGCEIRGVHIAAPDQATTGGIIDCSSNGVKDLEISAVSGYPVTVPLINGNLSEPPRTGQIPWFTKTAAFTLRQSDHLRTCGVDATAGAVTITLPAVGCVGCILTVKKTDSGGNAVTVTRASSATIQGATTYALTAQYNWVRLISDGTNWQIVGSG